jgi:hypothetical protein
MMKAWTRVEEEDGEENDRGEMNVRPEVVGELSGAVVQPGSASARPFSAVSVSHRAATSGVTAASAAAGLPAGWTVTRLPRPATRPRAYGGYFPGIRRRC